MDKRLKENLDGIQQDYIAPFLWLHNEADELIVNEIQRIYESGIRSVCLESRTHEEFCKDDWWSDVELILKECKKRDMHVWILDDKHFPSGYANGVFEKKHSDLRPYFITEYHVDVAGPIKDGSAMASCYLENKEDEIVAVAACRHVPNTEKYDCVMDITDGLFDGMVYFDLPEGAWRIVFVVKTKRGRAEMHSAFADMLNPKAIDLFIEEVHEAHYKRFSQYFGNTFLGFFSDEPSFLNNSENAFMIAPGMQMSYLPWKDEFKDSFGKNANRLVGVWFEIDGISDDVRYNYMNLVTNEYKKNFSDKIGTWCHLHNVMYIGHIIEDNNMHAKLGQGGGHYFRALSGQDMSGVDVVLQQILPGFTESTSIGFNLVNMNERFFNYYLAKLGSSYAHIDPQKKGRAMCEIFGAYGWAEGTKIMKYLMDHMLVRGINYYVPHAFSPLPNDTDCPPNFYDSGNNPQFKFFKNNMDYMNRMCHMLSDGKHVSACAILYDAENQWLNTDGMYIPDATLYAPESKKTKRDMLPVEDIAKKLYDNCLDYDIIPADYIKDIKDSSLNGEKYNVLFVPYAKNIPQDIVKALKNADVKVVMVCRISEEGSEYDFEKIILEDIPGYMNKKDFADVKTDYTGIYLRYYHYTRDNADIYMFVNEDKDRTISANITLSAFAKGEYIEYDGFENKACIKHTESNEIPITINPYHSVMIIVGDVDKNGIDNYKERVIENECEINPKFEISLAEDNSREFKHYKTTDKLFNINGRDGKSRFSGHIKYETEIDFDKICGELSDIMVDFEYVGEIAELYINDKYVGTKQIPPYSFQVSKEDLKHGKNKMKVVVSTHKAFKMRDIFSKFMLFEPTGLMGTVKIKRFKQNN